MWILSIISLKALNEEVLSLIVYLDEDEKSMEISIREIAFSATTSNGEGYVSRRLRALIGHQAHHDYQTRTDSQTEYYVKFPVEVDNWSVLVRGRVDVVNKQGNHIHLEEIKSTTQVIEDDMVDEAYELQLQLYCHYFYTFEGFSSISANLVIVDPVNKKEEKITINPRPMADFLQSHLSHLIKVHLYQQEVKETLKQRISTIRFPYPEYRPQQQEIIRQLEHFLSVGVSNATDNHSSEKAEPEVMNNSDASTDPLKSSHFMLHAPPGIGKTITTLYPLLRYAIANGLRLFVITSKTTQQLVYKETIDTLHATGSKFKAIQITAKGKMCKTDRYDCYDHDCPYFENYLATDSRDVVDEILELDMIDRKPIEQQAEWQRICPFELSLDVASQCDVIVSDFNYIFHPRVRFQRFQAEFDDSLLIIDEAHNLVDRARDYYSDTLSIAEVEEIIKFVRQLQVSSQLKYQLRSHLKRIIRYIQRMKDQIVSLEVDHSLIKIEYDRLQSYQEKLDLLAIEYLNALPFVPEKKDTLIKFTDKLKFFTLLLKESEAEEFEHIYDLSEKRIRILCTSAAVKLSEQMQLFDSVVVQSATLQPLDYYQDMLGLDETALQLDYPPPFDEANRLYLVDNSLSTTYKERSQFYRDIAMHITQIAQLHEGNYLVFFPSFDYLYKVSDYLEQHIARLALQPDGRRYSVHIQKPDMVDQDREQILQKLTSGGNQILLAVMGGIFSEGVDYSGDMATGAFIISPGLPQINFDNELIRDYFDRTRGKGFDYAYRFPGMAKVIQAAGRVFRSEKDRGFVVFMGHRFSTPDYLSLIPSEYQVTAGGIKKLVTLINKFWQSHSR